MRVKRGTAIAAVISVASASALALASAPAAHGWANGNTAPLRTLQGPQTSISLPTGIEFAPNGALLVASLGGGGIAVHSPDWTDGNAAPGAFFSHPGGGPSGLTFDSQGRLVVTDIFANTVTVYPADYTSQAPPIKVLTGDATGLDEPTDVAFDRDGRMYVTNRDNDSVTVYAANWADGNTAPVKVLQGAATGLDSPHGVAFDAQGLMYVANLHARSVTAYAVDWAAGDTAPVKSVTGSGEQRLSPMQIAFDSIGRMFVPDWSLDRVWVFAPNWSTGAQPVKILSGPATGLDNPASIAFDSAGQMFVGNYTNSSVTVYSANPLPPGSPTEVTAARAGNGSVTVSWAAPGTDGGAPVTKYTVIPSSGASRCEWTSGPLTCTVTGLANGARYTFTVVATNEAGASPASTASRGVVPLPPSPTITSVSPQRVVAGTTTRMTIAGTGFVSGQMTVTLRTVGRRLACTAPTVVSSSKLTCQVPRTVAGSYSVSVGFRDFAVSPATTRNALIVQAKRR